MCEVGAQRDHSKPVTLIEGEDRKHENLPIKQALAEVFARMWKYKYATGLIHWDGRLCLCAFWMFHWCDWLLPIFFFFKHPPLLLPTPSSLLGWLWDKAPELSLLNMKCWAKKKKSAPIEVCCRENKTASRKLVQSDRFPQDLSTSAWPFATFCKINEKTRCRWFSCEAASSSSATLHYTTHSWHRPFLLTASPDRWHKWRWKTDRKHN